MFTELLTSQVGSRLIPFKITTTATPSITANIGGDNFTTLTRNAAGKATLVPVEPWVRVPVVIGGVASSIADGGYVNYDTTPVDNSIVLEALSPAGAGDDGSFYGLALGWDWDDTDVTTDQILRCSNRGARIILGQVTSAAAISQGAGQFTITNPSTGVYVLTYSRAFSREPLVFVTPIAAAQKSYKVTSTAESATITMYSAAEAAEANAFLVLVFGFDSTEDTGRQLALVNTPRGKTRMIGLRVDGVSGTPVVGLGNNNIGITDNGTGDYTLDFSGVPWFDQVSPTYGKLMVFGTSKDSRFQLAAVPTDDTFQMLQFGATGTAADDNANLIVFASEDSTDY